MKNCHLIRVIADRSPEKKEGENLDTKNKNPSDIIQEFIDLIQLSHDEYIKAKQMAEEFNSHTYEWTHRLEDARNKQERNKLATAWQRELKERRKAKDTMSLWKELHEFALLEQNKPTIKRLNQLLQRQRSQENYLEIPPHDREYKKKV